MTTSALVELAVLAGALCLIASAVSAGKDTTTVSVVAQPKTVGGNAYYAANRAPLLPSPLIKLTTGSVRPDGWVRRQMELMAEGFSGRLPELSEFCKIEGNAWVSPTGEGAHGWEEVPYWLKGYVDLGYVLGDKRIISESKPWIDGILGSQRANGYFGPKANLDAMDLWPNMPILHALRSHYEATGDKRVLPFMSKYFKWQTTVPFEELLHPFWQQIRGGDNLDSIYWLYNHTGEKWLLDAARVIHERTADWTIGIPNWHGVNLGQGFREPGQYYIQTRDARYLSAAERNYDTIRQRYGQVPGGLFGADENCREGYYGPRQGAETCTMAEMMYSHELLATITGNPVWADRCEEIAFNSLPASMTPDLKGLRYLTAPNMVQSDRVNKAPLVQNGGDMFSYNPYGYRCCQHNAAFGWPYFSEHMWMATQGNGLAMVMYGPCEVTAKVGDGTKVKITETTGYPFDETVTVAVDAPKAVEFPLYLRVPGWCDAPSVAVNGKALKVASPARGWIMIRRTWRTGDSVKLQLPMQISVHVWEANRRSVSVSRGPLTYSLRIGERWEKYGDSDKWPGYEVFASTPWNYGLEIDPKNPANSFKVEEVKKALAPQPFTPDCAPISLKTKGRRIPQWRMAANGMVGELQMGPVKSEEPVEEITLVPMGCQRLRISAFPQIGTGSDAREWDDESAPIVTASHYFNTPDALNDGRVPKSSNDTSVARFTWWDHRGTAEWVQYSYDDPRKISSCEVYWYDDEPAGQCRTPASWRVLWWDGSAWQPVANPSQYGTSKNGFNRVEFGEIETTMLRLEAQLHPGFSAGILEWRAGK